MSSSNLSASNLHSIAGMEALKDFTLSLHTIEGLPGAELASMKLERLCLQCSVLDSAGLLHSLFSGSTISQTLVTFEMRAYNITTPIDDDQVAVALASCHNLKKLFVNLGEDICLFGRNGLAGLQAMATGCPLLADVFLNLSASAVHYVGTHFTNLTKCAFYKNRAAAAPTPSESFPSVEELRTLYPEVEWAYFD